MLEVKLIAKCHRCDNEADAGASVRPWPDTGIAVAELYPKLPDGWQIWIGGPICKWCLGAIADLPCLATEAINHPESKRDWPTETEGGYPYGFKGAPRDG